MSQFPDTSYLCAIYRTQDNSARADDHFSKLGGPLKVSTLLLLEFRQSLRLQARLHRNDRTKGFPQRECSRMLQQLQSDLSSGVLEVVPVDWSEVHQIAETLSAKHTLERGCRFADLLHVATALHLGSREFLTFDAGQKRLAEAEGMDVPL